MRLSLGQELRLVQKQILAPRMIQSMEILQLPIMALQERIEQEMSENPILELREEDPDLPSEDLPQEPPDAPSDLERELVIDESADNEKGLDDFFARALFTPNKQVTVDTHLRYDTDNSELHTFNTRLIVDRSPFWESSTEYRYTVDDSSLLSEDVTLYPNRQWAVNVFGRHEFENSHTEEIGGYLQRNLDCMSIRAGATVEPSYTRSDGTRSDTEWGVILELWLTAFPDIGVGRHRH